MVESAQCRRPVLVVGREREGGTYVLSSRPLAGACEVAVAAAVARASTATTTDPIERRQGRVRARQRWITRWKPALNAFAITFEGRIFPNDIK